MFPGKTIPYKFILLASLILIADFAIENINHKFQLNDFKVYYSAANAITSSKQLYGIAFALGSGFYKYSPFTALLFYPLSILPYYIACVLQFLLTSIAVIYTAIMLLEVYSKYFSKPIKSPNLILSVSLLCIATHLVRELELGNVNMILLLLLCLTSFYIIREKFMLAGILLAIVIITKPFFILLLIPLAMRRYFKTIFTTAVIIPICILIPVLVVGITKDIDLHKQWLDIMLIHAEGFPSPNTIEALFRNAFFPALPGSFQYIIILVLLVPYILFVRSNILHAGNNEKLKSFGFIIDWFCLIALMPLLFKTDTEHFLMTFPLILFILINLFSNKNIPLIILFIISIILYAGNSSDLLGKSLSLKMYNMGVLGISDILIIGIAVFVWVSYLREKMVEVKGSYTA